MHIRRFAVERIVLKSVVLLALVGGYATYSGVQAHNAQPQETAAALKQLAGDGALTGELAAQLANDHAWRNQAHIAGWILIGGIGMILFSTEIRKLGALVTTRRTAATSAAMLLAIVTMTGCWRPFEPVQLETINPNEEAFLLPLLGDVSSQTSTNNEEYLRSNLVYTKQVKIPQQWVQQGYEYLGPNGQWKAAAILVKVDKSPVTREWTADPNSGTSNKNEAIWVMTSDQVEFSTGWTCTARIASRDDAVKFLHNYPNGSLEKVMDTEVRAKLQADFGLEVTDLPMDELRKQATPHLVTTVDAVTKFFKERGITITNLGITGGFVYKDKTIMDTMVKVFNAEQEKSIASAAYQAQEMKNKTIESEATGKGNAILTERKAEADGIKLVADAKAYEMEKAKTDADIYLTLKRIELEKEKLTKWDGRFPTYFMGGNGNQPDLLLQMPAIETSLKSTSQKVASQERERLETSAVKK
jgi:hypothetical protein